MPQYADVADPVLQASDEALITVKAAAIKHIDRSRASGTHYTTENNTAAPVIIGGDGVGLLKDGTRVYAIGDNMVAEKAVIDKERMVKIPKGVDDITAAALPNAVIGSVMALRFRAGMKKGETVLINGATGFTGKMAAQVAKYYGAKRIIATGRNEQSLRSLLTLGADEVVSINQNDEPFVSQIKDIHNNTPIDIVIDYLWGHSAELMLSAFKGIGLFTHRTRFVSVGAVTGDKIQLSAENLRSVNLQLNGSGLGSWTKDEVKELLHKILPRMFKLAASGELKAETITVALKDIAKLSGMEIPDGKRLVVTM